MSMTKNSKTKSILNQHTQRKSDELWNHWFLSPNPDPQLDLFTSNKLKITRSALDVENRQIEKVVKTRTSNSWFCEISHIIILKFLYLKFLILNTLCFSITKKALKWHKLVKDEFYQSWLCDTTSQILFISSKLQLYILIRAASILIFFFIVIVM